MTAYRLATTLDETPRPVEQPTTTLMEVLPEAPPAELHQPSARVRELLAEHRAERQAIANRVARLFPEPEACEWKVPEVGYDRRRRAEVEIEAKAS